MDRMRVLAGDGDEKTVDVFIRLHFRLLRDPIFPFPLPHDEA